MNYYLTRIDPPNNVQRFYEIAVAPSLFEPVTVQRRYGRINGHQRILSPLPCEDEEAAAVVVNRLLRKRLTRGYTLQEQAV